MLRRNDTLRNDTLRLARRTALAAVLAVAMSAPAAAFAQQAPGPTPDEPTAGDRAAGPLPSLVIEPGGVTVSGISSGGYMAHQMHVAHSASIAGAGVVAGGPYHCAGSGFPFNLLRTYETCMNLADLIPFMGPPELAPSIAQTKQEALKGRIDDPAHLRGAKLYLFSGRLDETVPQPVMDVLKAYYESFADPKDIAYVNNIRAGHAMITETFGNACDTSASPFVNDCDYDAAHAILAQLYGPLRPPDGESGEIMSFAQDAIVRDAARHGLARVGYAFIPDACAGGASCRLHVAFHGCRQSAEAVGDAFYRHAGYNPWAAANNIVVLYPQATAVRKRLLGIALPWPNPLGCWDWWGYTGPEFDLKSGYQIAAVAAMIDRLTGSR